MRIKFITLNIFLGEFIDEAVKFLKQENPDIFVLQEVYDTRSHSLGIKYRMLQNLSDNFPGYDYSYSPSFFTKINGDKVDCGNVIFSKLTIKDTEQKFFYRQYVERTAETVEQFFLTPRNMQQSTIYSEDKLLHVFNLHGVWGLDGKDNEDRLRMSEAIVKEINGKQKVVLAGDMNVDPDTQTILNIEKHMKNVFKGELTSTFNMRRKPSFSQVASWRDNKGYEAAVVDMMFVSPDIKVIDHYCPKVDISDHFPLVAILEI